MVSKAGLAVGVSAAVVTALAAPVVVGAVVGALGFGSAGWFLYHKISIYFRSSSYPLNFKGVAAGSVAAGLQAGIGNVVAGSTFAMLQSVGAAGIGKVTVALTASGIGAVAGAATSALRSRFFRPSA